MKESNYSPNGTHQHFEHYNGKCVCQICTCNYRHRCPEPTLPLEIETTHRHFYTPHQVSSFSPRKKAQVQYSPPKAPYEPEDLKTHYQIQYKPHKINPSQGRPATSKTEYQSSPFKFEGQSEYKHRYSPLKVANDTPRRYSPTKREYVPSPHKFEGNTTYNHDYIPKKVEQPSSPSPRKKLDYSPSKFPLETETTYGKFYKPHTVEAYTPSPQAKKRAVYVPSPEKFEGQTRYREVAFDLDSSTVLQSQSRERDVQPSICPNDPTVVLQAKITLITILPQIDGSDGSINYCLCFECWLAWVLSIWVGGKGQNVDE